MFKRYHSIMPPPASVLSLYRREGVLKARKHAAPNYNTIQRKKMHTLQRFGSENFRAPISVTSNSSTLNSIRKSTTEELWRHTREPMKAPLLQKLQHDKVHSEVAVTVFTLILKYMGDLPKGRESIDTDRIFGSALNNEMLRDEIFCQIMRQLTDNQIQISEERGWDLLWLATGVMVPSQQLLKELFMFLKSRKHPLAPECLQRAQKTLKIGNRKFPPYIVEVEAIRYRSVEIYHKVYFPDDTDEAFQIESSTKTKDLLQTITRRLDLKSIDGFSLFIKIGDKVFSMPEEYFIFDFIYELMEWMRETMPSRSNDNRINCEYQLFFMKKLWINVTPGKDPIADEMFYFYQEVPKLLQGYYKLTKAEAVELAAHIFWAQYEEQDVQHLQKAFPDMLHGLIPEDVVRMQKVDQWKKDILAKINALNGISQAAAKLEFLKIVHKLPMFGSTFFVVKQATDQNLPETLLVAINKQGFNLIDPRTKDTLAQYSFMELNFWSSGNTYFHIKFGNMMGSTKLLLETKQGYKMDDLLTSYIRYFKTQGQRN